MVVGENRLENRPIQNRPVQWSPPKHISAHTKPAISRPPWQPPSHHMTIFLISSNYQSTPNNRLSPLLPMVIDRYFCTCWFSFGSAPTLLAVLTSKCIWPYLQLMGVIWDIGGDNWRRDSSAQAVLLTLLNNHLVIGDSNVIISDLVI